MHYDAPCNYKNIAKRLLLNIRKFKNYCQMHYWFIFEKSEISPNAILKLVSEWLYSSVSMALPRKFNVSWYEVSPNSISTFSRVQAYAIVTKATMRDIVAPIQVVTVSFPSTLNDTAYPKMSNLLYILLNETLGIYFFYLFITRRPHNYNCCIILIP